MIPSQDQIPYNGIESLLSQISDPSLIRLKTKFRITKSKLLYESSNPTANVRFKQSSILLSANVAFVSVVASANII